ncbi:MAG TPA: ATP-binding protein, partial [Nevskiaceae bacterium]|nr:ATP-binding protein [Nevskiaceae bacterium]
RFEGIWRISAKVRARMEALDVALVPEGGDELTTLDRNVALVCKALRMAREDLDRVRKEGGAVALEAALRDLSEAQAALERVGRLSAIGEMAAGVAHEISQPLTTMSMTLDLMSMDEAPRVTVDRGDLSTLQDMVDRIKAIADQLRSVSRQGQDRKREWVAPRLIVEQAMRVLAPHLRLNDVEISVDVPIELPKIHVNPVEMQQVLINLAMNGIDAMAGKSRKSLMVRGLSDAKRITLSVSDLGNGVPQELHEKIFTSFFTTKDPGKGTGLGLSICKRIVDRYGGTIGLVSNSDGSTFVVELPATPRA